MGNDFSATAAPVMRGHRDTVTKIYRDGRPSDFSHRSLVVFCKMFGLSMRWDSRNFFFLEPKQRKYVWFFLVLISFKQDVPRPSSFPFTFVMLVATVSQRKHDSGSNRVRQRPLSFCFSDETPTPRFTLIELEGVDIRAGIVLLT